MIDRRTFAGLLPIAAAATAAIAAPKAAEPRRALIKPRRLSPGDTVALVCPASATFEREDIVVAREQLEAIGFKVLIAPHAYDRPG